MVKLSYENDEIYTVHALKSYANMLQIAMWHVFKEQIVTFWLQELYIIIDTFQTTEHVQ